MTSILIDYKIVPLQIDCEKQDNFRAIYAQIHVFHNDTVFEVVFYETVSKASLTSLSNNAQVAHGQHDGLF